MAIRRIFWKYSEFHEYLPKKADQSADSGFLDFLRIDICGFYKYIFKGNFFNKKNELNWEEFKVAFFSYFQISSSPISNPYVCRIFF